MAKTSNAFVTTLQNHVKDQDVVLMACEALWSNVCGLENLKRHLLKVDGGIDAVACVLVIASRQGVYTTSKRLQTLDQSVCKD